MNGGDSVFAVFPFQCRSVLLTFISSISLFLLLNTSNPHSPTLECVNFVKPKPRQISPQCVAYNIPVQWNVYQSFNPFDHMLLRNSKLFSNSEISCLITVKKGPCGNDQVILNIAKTVSVLHKLMARSYCWMQILHNIFNI